MRKSNWEQALRHYIKSEIPGDTPKIVKYLNAHMKNPEKMVQNLECGEEMRCCPHMGIALSQELGSFPTSLTGSKENTSVSTNEHADMKRGWGTAT